MIREPECDGNCIYGSDLGVPYGGVAYPDPHCTAHGDHDRWTEEEGEVE